MQGTLAFEERHIAMHESIVALRNRQSFFVSTEQQLEIARQRNKERGWGFTESEFTALGPPPAWPKNHLCAVVLDVSLDTAAATFQEAWNFTAAVWPNAKICDQVWSSADRRLRLLGGITHQRSLTWRAINLAANWDGKIGKAPKDFSNHGDLPHSAILWAVSYFPQWADAMDGINVPFVWVPGYRCNISNLESWSDVPHLFWQKKENSRQFVCKVINASSHGRQWAIPAYC